MRYQSTRGETSVSASEAIFKGIAPDGGLFVPQEFPQVDPEVFCGLTYPQTAKKILSLYLTDYDPEFLEKAATQVYGENFSGKAGEIRKVRDCTYALELWHGPTCAFKDYALQLMPHLLVKAKENLGITSTTKILTATSGDTGKAALAGYADIDGIKIAVFYPADGTSEVQRLQMATQSGDNVKVYAVRGNFDDAQTAVKRAFADKELERRLAEKNETLSSANSINWGRLVPQIVYYFYSYAQLVQKGEIRLGQKISYCVPTGNFGDILAGYYAMCMGLPIEKLICASNENNVLTDFIRTGVYDARRTFYRTSSPSMDILVSSNLERLLYHVSGSSERTAQWMRELSQNGFYQVSEDVLSRIQDVFACGCADDAETAQEIRMSWEENRYLCDTHTAVALRTARTAAQKDVPCVVLSTANAYKFPRAVLCAIKDSAPEDEFEAMRCLEKETGAQIPPSLAGLREQTVRFCDVIEKEDVCRAALEL